MTAAAPGLEVGHPLRRILIIVGVVICGAAFAELVGWDIRAWFSDLWDTLTSISVEYIVAAILAMTCRRRRRRSPGSRSSAYAYPGEVRWMQVYAAYAACVGMNNILPANLGTFVMFVMLMTVIVSATFAGMIGGFHGREDLLHARGRVRLPLPLPLRSRVVRHRLLLDQGAPVGDRDPCRLGCRRDRAGGAAASGRRSSKWWEQAKEGGQILARPGAYFGRVFFPEFVALGRGPLASSRSSSPPTRSRSRSTRSCR